MRPDRSIPLGITLFALLTAASAARYPGGSYCDPRARGFDLARNYVCDLSHARAINGGDHRAGALLAQLGALCLVAAAARLWWRFPPRGAVRRLGALSTLGAALVPLTPSDRVGRVHTLAVLLAGVAGVAAVVLAARAMRLREKALGYAAVALGALDLGLYARAVALGIGCDPVTPLAQKLVAAMIVAWLVLADRVTRR